MERELPFIYGDPRNIKGSDEKKRREELEAEEMEAMKKDQEAVLQNLHESRVNRINLDLEFLNTYKSIAASLSRIADHFDPPKPNYQNRRLSDTRDLGFATAEHIARREASLKDFAASRNVVPFSEAQFKALQDYENQVGEVYGPAAVEELPWRQVNKAPSNR